MYQMSSSEVIDSKNDNVNDESSLVKAVDLLVNVSYASPNTKTKIFLKNKEIEDKQKRYYCSSYESKNLEKNENNRCPICFKSSH